MRRLRLSLLLLLLLLLPLSAEGLPAPESMGTQEIVRELSLRFQQQSSLQEEAQKKLEDSQRQLEESQKVLQALKDSSVGLKAELETQQEDLVMLSQQLGELKVSLPSLIEEQQRTISKQNVWLWILSAGLVAAVTGITLSIVIR